jgi:Uma2 family endonuclease
MARPAPSEREGWEDTIPVPGCVRLPLELEPPDGFDPLQLETWPRVDGRLEWVAGRLCWMPPCGYRQGATVMDVATVLGNWVHAHPDFGSGSNEAGFRLGDDVRAADAAVWHRSSADPRWPGLVDSVPVLAVEVGGRDEPAAMLRAKGASYLAHGVSVVWLVLPDERQVVVLTGDDEATYRPGETVPPHPCLPDLVPAVDDLLRQVLGAG